MDVRHCAEAATGEGTMELTREDSGADRSVHVGEEIQLRLPENPTTGYRWQAEVDSTVLRQTDDRYVGKVMPRGAGGVRLMRYEALHPGEATLRLAKRRSGTDQVIDEFFVRLNVLPQ